jgi:pilus assembly protein FimV
MMINTPPIRLRFSWQLLCIALVLSEPAAALTLGELTINSAVGQRFRGSVSYQLSPEDGLAEDCSKLSIIAPNNDLPGLGQASLRLQSKERGGQILIQSADVVYEPMASFSIKMECKGQHLQRSYTVFLDPAPLNPPSVAEETQPITKKPSTTAVRSHAQRTANISKPKIQTPPPLHSEQKNTAAVAAPPAEILALPASGGQLRIESELNIKNQAPAVLSPEELKTKIAMMQSLQEQLQSEMTRLQQSMQHLQMLSAGKLSASTTAPAASLKISNTEPPIPSSAPTPTAPAIQRHQAEDQSKSSWWMAAVIALLAAGAGVGLWLRRRQNQNTWDADVESAISQLSRPLHKPNKQTDAQDEHSLFRHSQLFYGGIEVQEEDGSATLERAQLLVAQGETDQAIELLYHTIEENEADNEPWLLLFRVLRQQGMKTEYAQLARRFHDLDGDADDWALVRNIGYRLDPENPLYSAHNEEVESTTLATIPADVEEITKDIVIEHDFTPPSPIAAPVEVHTEPEPLREQDAMLMDFLSTPSDADSETIPEKKSSVPQVISLDLPPLDFAPAEDENSPLDLALQSNPDDVPLSDEEVETIEVSTPSEDEEPFEASSRNKDEETIEASSISEDKETFEEIDLVELEIELQPPLSVFEPRKH